MKKVCASCGKSLGELEGGKESEISHGICKACLVHFLADTGISLDEYIEGFDIPIVAFVGDARAVLANTPARNLLGQDIPAQSSLPIGDVFECEYALLPEGCGQTVHCSGCAIRNAVTSTMKTGIPQENVPAYISHRAPNGSRQTEMLISTEKRAGIVFLSITGWQEQS